MSTSTGDARGAPRDTDCSEETVSVKSDGEKRCIIVWPGSQARVPGPPPRLPAQVDLVAPLRQFLQEMQENTQESSSGEGAGTRAISGIILDLDGVDYLNSAGIGSIFALRKYAKANGAEVVISRPRATIRRLLETVNLPALIPVTGDLDEARKQLETFWQTRQKSQKGEESSSP